MKNKKRKIAAGAILIFLMGIIFVFSAQTAGESSHLSGNISKFIFGVYEWLFGEVSGERELRAMEIIHSLIRSLAHGFEYFLLEGAAFANAVLHLEKWKKAAFSSVLFCMIFALTDEIHQLFVEGRAFQLADIAVDTLGALVCLVICLWVTKDKLRMENG